MHRPAIKLSVCYRIMTFKTTQFILSSRVSICTYPLNCSNWTGSVVTLFARPLCNSTGIRNMLHMQSQAVAWFLRPPQQGIRRTHTIQNVINAVAMNVSRLQHRLVLGSIVHIYENIRKFLEKKGEKSHRPCQDPTRAS